MASLPVLQNVAVDDLEPIEIGEGCWRRDLPSRPGMRIWIVDIAPGAQWPHVDRHGQGGEDVYILSGSMIDDGNSFPAGTFLSFAPIASISQGRRRG